MTWLLLTALSQVYSEREQKVEQEEKKNVQFGRERSLRRFKVAENNHSVGKGNANDAVIVREIDAIKEKTCVCTETVGKIF